MKTLKFFFLFTFFALRPLFGAVPADLSFMVLDLKYNPEDGVKICEMQQPFGSVLPAEKVLYGKVGRTAERLCQLWTSYHPEAWVMSFGISFYYLPTFSEQPLWHVKKSMSNFKKLDKIPDEAKFLPSDPSSISNYSGLFIGNYYHVNLNNMKKDYPGLIVVNQAFSTISNGRHLEDKAVVSALFTGEPALERLKPEWGLYPKPYSRSLTQEILKDFSSEYLVIKPRSSTRGTGVIILHRDDLDATLEYILTKSNKLSKDPDKAYNHWSRDRHTDFIVEAYYPSQIVSAPHLGDHDYDPTMRVVVAFCYDQGEVTLHCVESHWKLPEWGLDEDVSPTDKHKSFSMSEEHYVVVDEKTHSAVESQLREGLGILYKRLVIADQKSKFIQ